MARKGKNESVIEQDELAIRRAALAESLNSRYGYPVAAGSYQKMLSQPRWFIPVGEPTLDFATGGGLPEGRAVRLYGPPGIGKTAYAITTMLKAMAMGGFVFWGDTDQSFDPLRVASFADSLGLEFKEELFFPLEPKSFEHFIDILYDSLQTMHPINKKSSERPVFEQPLIFIYDALSSTPLDEEIEELPGEGVGKEKEKTERKGNTGNQRAKVFRKELRKISNSLGLHGAALLFSEHSTVDLNFRGRIGMTSSGGDGPKFHASTSIQFSRVSEFQDLEKVVVGQKVYWTVEKCRFQKPRSRGVSVLDFNRGFLGIETLFEVLNSIGVIPHTAGGNYKFNDPTLGLLSFTRRNIREKVTPEWEKAMLDAFYRNSEYLWNRKTKLP